MLASIYARRRQLMTSQTASKVTDRQILEMKRQLEVVAYRYLSLESAQMIIERGDVFQSRLGDLLRELGGMFPNQYESERVDRTLDNPAGWSVPSFDEQRRSEERRVGKECR